MTDAFQLFPKKEHHDRWHKAEEKDPGICPGKDTNDTSCTCPDPVYATRVRLRTGSTFSSYLYCGCCDLLLTKFATLPSADPLP